MHSQWLGLTSGRCAQIKRAFVRLLLVLAVLLWLISRGGSFAASVNANRVAKIVVQNAMGLEFSWTHLNWWKTPCRADLGQASSQGSLPGLLSGDPRQPRIGNRLVALSQLVEGDCEGAIATLEQGEREKPGYSVNDLLLAHLYVMTAAWKEVPTVVLPTSLVSVSGTVRRFWANAYYRIGVSPASPRDDKSTWVQAADRLTDAFPLEGSVDLASYLSDSGRPVEAFDELRRAMVSMTTPEVWSLYPMYTSLRQAVLAARAQQDPNDSEVQRLYQKYSVDSAVNLSDRQIALSTIPIPEHQFHYEVSPGWELIGMDLDKDDLQMGPLVHTTFYWCQRVDLACARYIAVAGVSHNLISNSCFEWDPPLSGIRPFGFLGGYYGERSPFPYNIIAEGDSQAFCLNDDPGHESAGIITGWRKLVDEGTSRLILGGSFRTEKSGTAYIGLHWRSDADRGLNHIVAGESADDWTARAGIVELPYQATDVAFHLLRFRSQGIACFDDLFAFHLPSPPGEPVKETP